MGIEALLQSQVIGLTSALAAKLDLSGGTLTGPLSGTTLELSGRLDAYNIKTSATSYERGKFAWESDVLRIGTEKGSAGGSARALELQTDGTTRLTFATTGLATFANDVISNGYIRANGANGFWAGATSYIFWNGRVQFSSPSASRLLIEPNSGSDLRVELGGSTSAFPSLKRNSAAINFRLADDSGDCDITAKAATFSGNVTLSGVNVVTDTTSGTKIGTGTTQKLGFWNATPVVQPSAVADATDAASAITQLNALLSRLRSAGLIAA